MSEQISIPSIDQFVQELDKESRWYDLGVFLGVPTSELDIIGQNYRLEGIQRCLIELFKCFQSRTKPVTWNDIVDALSKMHNKHLADQIHHKYVYTDLCQHPLSPLHKNDSDGRNKMSESNTEMKDIGNVSKIDNDIVFLDPLIANNFDKITTSFACLVLDIRNGLQKKSVPLDEIQFFLQDLRNLEPLPSEIVTLEKIFSRLRQYYCFLNYHVLISIVDRFLSHEIPLKRLIKDYNSKLKQFKTLAKMKDLMKLIKDKQELYGSHKVVEIKLHSFWDKITIQRFERVVRVIFLESYKLHVQIRVVDGCVCVSWIVPDIYTCKNVLLFDNNFMRVLGIISLKIGDNVIYECLDEGCSVLESAFLQAFELEDVRAMELLIGAGCDTNTQTYIGEVAITSAMKMKDNNGFTLLHFASMNGHDDTVRILLESSTSHVDNTKEGVISLMSIRDVYGMLLHFGNDTDVKGSDGWTPLMMACHNGHSKVIELLLKAKANVNACLENGSSAIFIASQNGHSAVVSNLLQFGADPNLKSSDGWTPIMMACQCGRNDVVRLLLKSKVDVNACVDNGSTAIYIACQNGHSGVVSTLLKFGADLNIKEINGATPLMIACHNGHNDIVELLLKAEVDVNACFENGSLTAFYIACLKHHSGVVSTLLQFGADPNIKESDGWTPLMIACHCGHNDVVELLLKVKVDVSACLEDGSTAIYIASKNGHSDVVSALLKFGADPNIKRNNGWTPLVIARQNGHLAIVSLLLQSGADPHLYTKHQEMEKL